MPVQVLDVSGMNAEAVAAAVSKVESDATAAGSFISSVALSGSLLILISAAQSAGGAASPADEIGKLKNLLDQRAIGMIEFDDAKGRILRKI